MITVDQALAQIDSLLPTPIDNRSRISVVTGVKRTVNCVAALVQKVFSEILVRLPDDHWALRQFVLVTT